MHLFVCKRRICRSRRCFQSGCILGCLPSQSHAVVGVLYPVQSPLPGHHVDFNRLKRWPWIQWSSAKKRTRPTHLWYLRTELFMEAFSDGVSYTYIISNPILKMDMIINTEWIISEFLIQKSILKLGHCQMFLEITSLFTHSKNCST